MTAFSSLGVVTSVIDLVLVMEVFCVAGHNGHHFVFDQYLGGSVERRL